MLQGGISTVTSVTEASSTSESKNSKVSTGFGLSEAFSTLLKVDLSGSKEKSANQDSAKKYSEERVHTPASLFFQLRNLLVEKNYLIEPSNDDLPKAGEFVEFEGYLKRNPIIETMDSLSEMMAIAETFEDKPQNKGKQVVNQMSENQKIRQQMIKFSDSLKAGNTIDLTSKSLKTNYSAVITVETAFLNDPLMSDLVDGQFKVIGKVIKSVDDATDSINLLRKTALSKLPPSMLLEAFKMPISIKQRTRFCYSRIGASCQRTCNSNNTYCNLCMTRCFFITSNRICRLQTQRCPKFRPKSSSKI